MIGKKLFRAVFLAALSQFWTQKLAIFSQSEQCYAKLEQLFSPTVIYKLKMISNDVPQLLKMHDEQRVVVRRKYAVKQDCKLYYPTVGAQ